MQKVSIFVDVQNIYYTTRDTFNRSFNYKSFWRKIESTGEIVRANAYAIDKGDESQQRFQYALRSIGFSVKLKPYISRTDGTSKGDWDVGIAIDVLEFAPEIDKIILLSGDGDFDILVKKVIEKYSCQVDVYSVKDLTSKSLIDACTNYISINKKYLL